MQQWCHFHEPLWQLIAMAHSVYSMIVTISSRLNLNYLKMYLPSNVSIKRMGSVPNNWVPSQYSRQSSKCRSDYRKSLPGDFIRIRLKIEQNCRLFLDFFFFFFFQRDNKWFVHDYYIQAQVGCQMCLSAVKLDHSGELFWDTPSWLSAWVSVFWAWRMDVNKGVPTFFAYCEKKLI